MFKNYLKIILRNLRRNKVYGLINVIGLGVGIAALVWGIQTWRFSLSYNNFHKEASNIFRVLTKAKGSDNLKGICPLPLAKAAKNDFSNVKEAVQWSSRDLDVKADQNEPFASYANFTDPEFFTFFNFPLVRGSINLANRSTVLISETAAKKFFGNTDPLGKTLTFYSDEPYKKPLTVSGILKDPPFNSSFQFEMITHNDNRYKDDGAIIKEDDWARFTDAVFVRLFRPSEAGKLGMDFEKYIPLQQAAAKNIKLTSFLLEPLSQVADHLREIDDNYLRQRPENAATYGPLVLSILILLSACLNFANTSVAQCNRRLKEIGVRKVMGSSYRQIMFQQLFECACIVLLAIGLSALINNFWLPAFNGMFNFVHITANYFNDYTLLAIIALIFLSVTFLAGAYPAIYINRFNATNIFRGSVKFGGNNLFSRVLLGLQIVISFITVIASIAFAKNAEFQRTYDFGYRKENVIGLSLQNELAYTYVHDELGKLSGIEGMGGTRDQIGFSYRGRTLEAKGEKRNSRYLETGNNYPDIMGLKLVAGRGFNATGAGDYRRSMLINEKLAFDFGWTPAMAIGKQIRKDDTTLCTVIGVLKDFTQNTLFEPLQPISICLVGPENYSQIIIRTKPGALNKVYDQTKAVWAKLYPMKPLRAYYQDEVAAESSLTNQSVATIFFWFAIISMLLSATGMFALVSLSVLKKMREIALRKVLGANGKHIFRILFKGYSWIFLGAAITGCYAGYTLSKLLMDMIFQINAGVTLASLILSFLCVLVISGLTIGSRVWYAIHTKPTEILKGD